MAELHIHGFCPFTSAPHLGLGNKCRSQIPTGIREDKTIILGYVQEIKHQVAIFYSVA